VNIVLMRGVSASPSTAMNGRGFTLEYCHNVWYRKTRMAWLSDGEKSLRTWLITLFWHNTRTRRTARRTNERTDGHRTTA